MSVRPNSKFCFNASVIEANYRLLTKDRFKWNGLPKEIKQEYIENALYSKGQCFMFFDKSMGKYLCLPCSPTGVQNVYGEFLGVQVHGFGYEKTLSLDEGIWIRNNIECYPSELIVKFYIDKLIESDKTELINLEQQKIPFIISATKDNQLSVKNFIEKVKNGETHILVDKMLEESMGKEGIKSLSLNVPYLLDKIPAYRREITKELLTHLGINSANTDKKERLLEDEVNANNEEVLSMIEKDLFTRQLACEQANEKFGFNMSCEVNKKEVKGGIEIYDNNRIKQTGKE